MPDSLDTTLDTLPLDSNSASKAVGGFVVLGYWCACAAAQMRGFAVVEADSASRTQWGFVSSFFMGFGA